jgi:hypothetical protein
VPFPDHIARVLDSYGVTAETKAALFDLYVSLGGEVLEVFADLAEEATSASVLTPADTVSIRSRVVESYLRRNHPHWLNGRPTASLWHPRELEGRASGLAMPLGGLGTSQPSPVLVSTPLEGSGAAAMPLDFATVARRVVGDDQPLPAGILMLGRNAHYGGRHETISFDVVAAELEDAIAIGQALGQQHTLPGSVGETSGTFDAAHGLALLWEIQPNVYKPADERNRAIAKVYRKHRNWHLVTLTAALEWLREQRCAIFILRGEALAATHEVNPEKPVSPTIAAHHDRTVAHVTNALGLRLTEPTDIDEIAVLDSVVMNHALRKHVLQHGAAAAMWRVQSGA